LAVVLVVGGACWFYWQRNPPVPKLPEIAVAQLDGAAASLIEAHLASVRAAPRSGEAWGQLGGLLRSFEFPAEAGQCLATAARLDSNNPRWPYLHGLLLMNRSPVEAAVLLRRAVALCGNQPEVPRWRLARLLAESGQWNEAQQHLRELSGARPEFTPALLALAQAALARNDLDEGIRLANRCTRDPRTARSAWSLMALLRERRGEIDQARMAGERAASVPPDSPVGDPFEAEIATLRGDPRSLSDRVQRLLQSGNLAQAGPLVGQLVRDHPRFAEGWLLLGRWQLLNKDPAAAEPSIRHHLEMDPGSVNGLFQLGMTLLATKRFEEAATVFRQSLELKTDFGPACYNLGFALARSGKKREAIAPFREAIRHNPERIDSYILLADLHLQFGERSEAEALVRQANAVDPKDPRIATLRARLAQ
jgi:tetratricopeptide (TPR) repeat protein